MISILDFCKPLKKPLRSSGFFTTIFKASGSGVLYSVLFCLTLMPSHAVSSDWIYSVRKGDTLWDLCATYTHVVNCWTKIGEYNGVVYPSTMAPGTRIKFPVSWLKNPPTTVKVLYVRGEVQKVLSSGESKPLTKDMDLSIGDSVSTGENSTSTLLFADDSILILEENSYVTMDSLSQARDESMVDSKVNLRRGSARARVPKPSSILNPNTSNTQLGNQLDAPKVKKPNVQRRFKIQTPSAVAAVRGTEFRVSARDEGKKMSGEVYSGEIRVSQEIKQKTTEQALVKKYGIVVKKDREMGNPVELLSAPELTTKDSVQYDHLSLNWKAMSGATQYVLSLFASSEPNNLLQKVETEKTNHSFYDLALGCYLIAIRGIDIFDLQGLVAEQEFCLKPLPGPPDARIEHDKDYNASVLSWRPVEEVSEYQVEFSNSESFSSIDKAVPAYGLDYTVTMVEKRNYNYIRVRIRLSDSILGQPSGSFRTK